MVPCMNDDGTVLLANIPAQAEFLLHSLEQAPGGIGLYINADKTEFMCFNQRGNISTLNGRYLKLVDKIMYLGSSVSSTENDINTWLAKDWIAIDWLSVILKSDLLDKIKCSFSQAAVMLILLYGCTKWTLTQRMESKAWWQLHKKAVNCTEQFLVAASCKVAAVWIPTTHLK